MHAFMVLLQSLGSQYRLGRYKSQTRSTRTDSLGQIDSINSDQLGSQKIKLEEIECFTHMKVKIPLKNKPICVIKLAFCILSASSSQIKLQTHVQCSVVSDVLMFHISNYFK